ncbi:GNAT family protein [Streptomyces sp. NPDC051001]|uniref:GNAT family N-acetyltransferase n=1 Tax=Streptomyces sp. NPDC051001 TaxID=3155795 RepID=UPI00343019A5
MDRPARLLVLPAGRGRGVVVEATKRLSQWASDDLGLHRLRLCHSMANPATCRVATKAGFLVDGTMRSALVHEDGWRDQQSARPGPGRHLTIAASSRREQQHAARPRPGADTGEPDPVAPASGAAPGDVHATSATTSGTARRTDNCSREPRPP